MKKFLSWLLGIGLAISALFFASKARALKKRSDRITEKEVQVLSDSKQQNLDKAAHLGRKAEAKLRDAKDAKQRAEELAKKVEESNAPNSLADRVRRFNDGL